MARLFAASPEYDPSNIVPIPNSPLVVRAMRSPFGDHAEKCGTPGPTPLCDVGSIARVTTGPFPSASALCNAPWLTVLSTMMYDENDTVPPSGDHTGNVYRNRPPISEPSPMVSILDPSGFTVKIEPLPSSNMIRFTGPVAIARCGSGSWVVAGSSVALTIGVGVEPLATAVSVTAVTAPDCRPSASAGICSSSGSNATHVAVASAGENVAVGSAELD